MAHGTSLYPTLADSLWPTDARGARLARNLVLAVLGSAALTLSAKIQVPFYPVPMTMQTYVVLVIGMAFGWRLAAGTVLLYLAQGALGLPVFAKGGGLAYLAGPTAGYLAGFLLSAGLIGWLAERGWDRRLPTALLAMLLGTVVIFLLGVGWLAQLLGDLDKAVSLGLLPFLWGALFKIALAAATLPFAWRLVQRFRKD